MHRFFVPINNVVVFDHLVGYERLNNIPLIFAVGVTLSDGTLDALKRCADEGADIVVWGNLARKYGWEEYREGTVRIPHGRGSIILVDRFSTNALWQYLWPHMGRPDEIRYTFGDHRVVLKRITDNDVDAQLSMVD